MSKNKASLRVWNKYGGESEEQDNRTLLERIRDGLRLLKEKKDSKK